jgi:GAF domain-containing protein
MSKTEHASGLDSPEAESAAQDSVSGVQRLIESGASTGEVFDSLLTEILNTTQSEYGFIGEVFVGEDGRPYLKTHAITNIAWNEETRTFYEDNAPQGLEFRNLRTLFGAAISSARPVISNDPAGDSRSGGLPTGHPAMHCFLGLPLMDEEGMVGMLGVANRPGGYDEDLLEALSPLSSKTARLLRLHRKLREDPLERRG